ncbi:MAG: hypothetical protein AB7O50_11800 [Pseudolabrys sp.]
MTRLAQFLRRHGFGIAALLSAALVAAMPASASDQRFPYDLELLLETPPMPPGKRMPALLVAANGSAVIDLWCRSVRGQLDLGAGTVAIQTEPLPPNPPTVLSRGQCTSARMQADERVLAALTQMTGWQRRGQAVVFTGATTLRFLPSSH